MMHESPSITPTLAAFRRPPSEVMRLARMGSAHPTRLSFLRTLLRRVSREAWQFDRPVWAIDARGVGHAVYRAAGPSRSYCLVAFAHDLPPEMRSDRVIATAWDATFALFDGEPTPDDIERLRANVPLQEAGRISGRELTLSRANRSVRLFDHVVSRLASGLQPTQEELDEVGYLMRTTAVYGSGKFGAADRPSIADRPELRGPFQAEMLTVWLIRAFTVDLVEHLARARGGATAASLDRSMRRRLGVGNSTGLGMAPFLIRHPALLNNWVQAREEALARIRSQTSITEGFDVGLHKALDEACETAALWHSSHPIQIAKLADLRADLDRIAAMFEQGLDRRETYPWDALWRWGERTLTLEGQEQLLALMLEPHGMLIDGLADGMDADEASSFTIDGAIDLGDFSDLLATHYSWALKADYSAPGAQARFWYVSEEKLEPRLGWRATDAGAEREQPLAIGRDISALATAMRQWDDATLLGDFLMAHPEHRAAARRVQITAGHPYAEIQDNLVGETMLPIDILRYKLAFFGATRFDPRSNLWVRISLFQGQPFPDEIGQSA